MSLEQTSYTSPEIVQSSQLGNVVPAQSELAASNLEPTNELKLPNFNEAPGHWAEQAACKDEDPQKFFPEKGGRLGPAKAICRGCDVRSDCLQYALDRVERFGVWGGLSERERGAVLRKMAKQALRAV